jgi:uncharacterized membrane protein HdeD (DUF308 family)
MLARQTRNWWVFLVRGLLAILLSILAAVWPDVTVKAIVILLGGYVLVDGVLTLSTGLVSPGFLDGGWEVFLAGAGIALGVMTLNRPDTATTALIYVIVSWALVKGTLETVAAVYPRRIARLESTLIGTGLLNPAALIPGSRRPGDGVADGRLFAGAGCALDHARVPDPRAWN